MNSAGISHFFGIEEKITLSKNGTWISNGEEITHEGTLLAFSKNICRMDNTFEINLGTETKTIDVEDTIYFVTALIEDSSETSPESSDKNFLLKLNDNRIAPLLVETIRYSEGRLTCQVEHPKQGTQEEAKFLTQPYYQLLRYLEQGENEFFLILPNKKIILDRIK